MTDKVVEQAETIVIEDISFEEYLVQYEGQRMEWHMGKVVKQVTNNTKHNLILGFMFNLLSLYLDLKELGQVVLAGVPMYISDEQPAREPDLMIVLNENSKRLTEKYLNGAADLAIEIISPGTGHIDRGTKFEEYEAAGVREYWIIDPLREEVLAYSLSEKGRYQRIEPEDNRIASSLLPDFVLDTAILWQDNLPTGMAVVKLTQGMMKD
jgi:Uma2 family endonuclease